METGISFANGYLILNKHKISEHDIVEILNKLNNNQTFRIII